MVKHEPVRRIPLQPLLGLALGAVSGVVYPGLYNLLLITWVIPLVIAGLLSISTRTRALAAGFAAAGVGWLVYYVSLYAYLLVASA
jgi:hypothetical protein